MKRDAVLEQQQEASDGFPLRRFQRANDCRDRLVGHFDTASGYLIFTAQMGPAL